MVETELTIAPCKKPWVLTFFGFLVAAGLVGMPWLAGPPDGDKMPDLVRFIGRFHPLLLHLPIGVFSLILFQELGLIFSKKGNVTKSTSLFPLFFGAASAIVAVIAGFLLYQGEAGFSGSALVERHMWAGLGFAVAAVVTFVLKAWTVTLGANQAYYRSLLFVSVGVMGFASHQGGSITHGEIYLTEFAPQLIRGLLGESPKIPKGQNPAVAPGKESTERLVYQDIVAPILEHRCVQCHKESKSKGKFRMDHYELLVKGGSEGAGLIPGDSSKSNIIIRMDLPLTDDEHMPPKAKTDIEDSEVAIIKWWIDHGADPHKKLSEFELPAPIKEAIAKLAPALALGAGEVTSSAAPSIVMGPDNQLKISVAEISKEFPGALSFESQQSALLAFTAVSLRGKLDDVGFKKLAGVSSQLVTLDLSATKITDQALSQLASARNLRVIRLAETGVTDASIEILLKLPNLESINLYATKVTDAGIRKLSAMPHLKRLYLWQTGVTPEAIKALKQKLPNCEILTGIAA